MKHAFLAALPLLTACSRYWVVESEPYTETLTIGPDSFATSYTVEVAASESAFPPGNFAENGPGVVGASLAWLAPPSEPITVEFYVGVENAAYPQIYTEMSTESYTTGDLYPDNDFYLVNVRSDGGSTADVLLTISATIAPIVDDDGNPVDGPAPSDSTLEVVVTEQ